jgi:hypothetical protein
LKIDLTGIGILGAASIDYTGADVLNVYGYVGNGEVGFIDGSYTGNLIGDASFTVSSGSFSLSVGYINSLILNGNHFLKKLFHLRWFFYV